VDPPRNRLDSLAIESISPRMRVAPNRKNSLADCLRWCWRNDLFIISYGVFLFGMGLRFFLADFSRSFWHGDDSDNKASPYRDCGPRRMSNKQWPTWPGGSTNKTSQFHGEHLKKLTFGAGPESKRDNGIGVLRQWANCSIRLEEEVDPIPRSLDPSSDIDTLPGCNFWSLCFCCHCYNFSRFFLASQKQPNRFASWSGRLLIWAHWLQKALRWSMLWNDYFKEPLVESSTI